MLSEAEARARGLPFRETTAESATRRVHSVLKNRTPTLKDLLRETATLRRQLQRLVKTTQTNISTRTIASNRILTNDWRYMRGGFHGPLERRYVEAVDWVNQFDAYVDRLRDYCFHELEAPDRFIALPLIEHLR